MHNLNSSCWWNVTYVGRDVNRLPLCHDKTPPFMTGITKIGVYFSLLCNQNISRHSIMFTQDNDKDSFNSHAQIVAMCYHGVMNSGWNVFNPITFTLFVTKIAIGTDSNSNCKFINIRCRRFETILRSIRYSVKFWRPSARIGRQNSIFPKIKLLTYLA